MNVAETIQKLRFMETMASFHIDSREELIEYIIELVDFKGHKSLSFPSGIESTACVVFMNKEFTATAFGDSYDDAETKSTTLALMKVVHHVRDTLTSCKNIALEVILD